MDPRRRTARYTSAAWRSPGSPAARPRDSRGAPGRGRAPRRDAGGRSGGDPPGTRIGSRAREAGGPPPPAGAPRGGGGRGRRSGAPGRAFPAVLRGRRRRRAGSARPGIRIRAQAGPPRPARARHVPPRRGRARLPRRARRAAGKCHGGQRALFAGRALPAPGTGRQAARAAPRHAPRERHPRFRLKSET